MPIILATQEAEIRRRQFEASPGNKRETLSQKYPICTHTKMGWWSGSSGTVPA
jgi:hypothetical protein